MEYGLIILKLQKFVPAKAKIGDVIFLKMFFSKILRRDIMLEPHHLGAKLIEKVKEKEKDRDEIGHRLD